MVQGTRLPADRPRPLMPRKSRLPPNGKELAPKVPQRFPSIHSGLLEGVLFSGLLPAAVAGGLFAASGLALGLPSDSPRLLGGIGLALFGTVVIYNIDRLRDLQGDRATAPARTLYIAKHRGALIGFTGLSALACAPLALTQPAAAWGLCAVAMGFGLLHRRLKNHSAFAVVYMTAAWLMVVVGIPSVDADPPAWQPGALAAIGIGLGISANLIASQLRGVNETSRTRRPLAIAKALAVAGSFAPLGLPGLWPLCAIPLCALLSLLFFRPDEFYGLLVLDGALLVGALIALGPLATAH